MSATATQADIVYNSDTTRVSSKKTLVMWAHTSPKDISRKHYDLRKRPTKHGQMVILDSNVKVLW